MPITKLEVDGYEALNDKLKSIDKTSGKVFVFFVGSKKLETGKSWCPDCVVADPNVEHAVSEVSNDISDPMTFITCNVGPMDYWKNPENHFKKDPNLKLSVVPTLVLYQSPGSRLVKDEEFGNVQCIVKFLKEAQ
ncbi:thioredoxin domain-containing protein 17 [Ditylenchus destructor]|uniref:Thioredoxin domain-containing protein 17 n=1 Tax=Ditylenchus destructor TaxID=166010 RepID=A0AAD4NA41_9BILA|nr:thioredoxin domain-containing protein 17 [Ditylenchus destructor]